MASGGVPPLALPNQSAEVQEVIQSLFDAFKILTEENVKKDRRIEKIESLNAQLRELISLHLVDGLEAVRRKVDRMDRLDSLEKELASVRLAVDDIKFSQIFFPQVKDRSPSPHRRMPPPLPFASSADPPISIGMKTSSTSLDKLQSAVENVLTGIDYMARQRVADVESINASLEKLNARMKQLAVEGDHSPPSKQSVIGYVSSHKNFNALMSEIRSVKDEIVPELESEWADRYAALAGKLDSMTEELRKQRAESAALQEKLATTQARMSQLSNSGDNGRRLFDRTEQLAGDINSRVVKIEADLLVLSEDMKRIEDNVALVSQFDSKVDLIRSECRSNSERTARQSKHDVDSLRVKLDRVAIVRDEYDRLSSEMKSLHDLVLAISTNKRPDPRPSLASLSPPPLVQASEDIVNSSALSVVDEGIVSAASGMTAKLSTVPSIIVPTGGAETGSLRVDPSTSRILWRIENVATILREPSRYPKILVSPEFSATKDGKPNSLTARMKLFPHGSDQSRIDGNCSFYLRCLPGVLVRYAVDIGGEVMETFECEYEKQRDKGKHDFVKLNEYLEPDGSVVIGIELKQIKPLAQQFDQ